MSLFNFLKMNMLMIIYNDRWSKKKSRNTQMIFIIKFRRKVIHLIKFGCKITESSFLKKLKNIEDPIKLAIVNVFEFMNITCLKCF